MDSSLKRGSVVLAIHPFTDLSSAKRRPALVVSATGRSGPWLTNQPSLQAAMESCPTIPPAFY
jgi:hypothetical protein